jgi:SAM-dependent methyltransferase
VLNKKDLVRLLPSRLSEECRLWFCIWDQHRFRRNSVTETFTRIYRQKRWSLNAGSSTDFESGPGSIGPAADSYVKMIEQLISEHNIHSVVDLGCGDFQIGARVAPLVDQYIGLDVVDELIKANKRSAPVNASFELLDATMQRIPEADVILIRQVLQHLSNGEILQILSNLPANTKVVVTESKPSQRPSTPNRDIRHGPHTRLPFGSYVNLEYPPFGIQGIQILGVIRTEDEEIEATMFVSSN